MTRSRGHSVLTASLFCQRQLDSGGNTTSPLFKEQKLLRGIPFCVQLDANHPELKIT